MQVQSAQGDSFVCSFAYLKAFIEKQKWSDILQTQWVQQESSKILSYQ